MTQKKGNKKGKLMGVEANLIKNLNTAFPLSGGEEDLSFIRFEKQSEKGKAAFEIRLNRAFPLSGGESDMTFITF